MRPASHPHPIGPRRGQVACAALLVLCTTLACAADNVCPVDATPVVAELDVSLDLRSKIVRRREAPVGNLIADVLKGSISTPADTDVIGLVHAGAIAGAVGCDAQELIDVGPVSEAQIAALLPFDDRIVEVQATGTQIIQALERSVAALADPGPLGESGSFLHVAGLAFAVDCAGVAAVSNGISGSRIVPGSVEVVGAVNRVPLADDQTYRIATLSGLTDNELLFPSLLGVVPGGQQPPAFRVLVEELGAQGRLRPVVEGRITLRPSCFADPTP